MSCTIRAELLPARELLCGAGGGGDLIVGQLPDEALVLLISLYGLDDVFDRHAGDLGVPLEHGNLQGLSGRSVALAGLPVALRALGLEHGRAVLCRVHGCRERAAESQYRHQDSRAHRVLPSPRVAFPESAPSRKRFTPNTS